MCSADDGTVTPAVCRDNLDWSAAPAIQEMPVVSAICEPAEGTQLSTYDGEVRAQELLAVAA
jgi:hypothetical protein